MKHKVLGSRMAVIAPVAWFMLTGCDSGSLKKNKAQEQNQARAVVDAHFYLPENRDLASAQGAAGDGASRTNAYQVSYKTVGRCEKVEDITFVGAYEQGKKVSLNFIPTCDYNFKVALGWSDQLAGAARASTGASNRIKPVEALDLSRDKPTYQTEIKDVIARNCLRCHNAGNALGGIDISDFAKAERRAQGSLGAIQRGTMPKGNPASMSAEDKRLFTLWVEQGTAENEPVVDDNDDASNDDNSNDDNDNSNDDSNNDNSNDNDNSNQDDTPQKPGNSSAVENGGGILATIFLESSLLEIRADQLEGKDEVEITDIRLKPTPDGEQAGFTSAVSTFAP